MDEKDLVKGVTPGDIVKRRMLGASAGLAGAVLLRKALGSDVAVAEAAPAAVAKEKDPEAKSAITTQLEMEGERSGYRLVDLELPTGEGDMRVLVKGRDEVKRAGELLGIRAVVKSGEIYGFCVTVPTEVMAGASGVRGGLRYGANGESGSYTLASEQLNSNPNDLLGTSFLATLKGGYRSDGWTDVVVMAPRKDKRLDMGDAQAVYLEVPDWPETVRNKGAVAVSLECNYQHAVYDSKGVHFEGDPQTSIRVMVPVKRNFDQPQQSSVKAI